MFVEGDGSRERILGAFNRRFTLFDRYVPDMTADPGKRIDRRVAVAKGGHARHGRAAVGQRGNPLDTDLHGVQEAPWTGSVRPTSPPGEPSAT